MIGFPEMGCNSMMGKYIQGYMREIGRWIQGNGDAMILDLQPAQSLWVVRKEVDFAVALLKFACSAVALPGLFP